MIPHDPCAGPLALSPEQLRTLRHMLGIDDPQQREPKPYRDYYCANPDDAGMAALVAAGAVEKYATQGGYEWFRCTAAGKAAGIASHRTIRYTKARRVYGRFLDVRDTFADLTFRQFLTDPEFAETRRSA